MKESIENIIEQIYDTTIVRAFENNNHPLIQLNIDRSEARKWLTDEIKGLNELQINEILSTVELQLRSVSKKYDKIL